MLKYLRLIGLLPLLFLILSCSGNSVVKDNSGQQEGGLKHGEENRAPETFRFVLNPGDEIAIKVWKYDDLSRSIQIDPSGNIDMPFAGELKASGLTISQLKKEITLRLSEYIVNPLVDIGVTNSKNLKIYILGEVASPGSFDWRMSMVVWEAIAKAGGFTMDADTKNILLIRRENGKVAVKALNLASMLKGGQINQDIYLKNDDIIYIKPTVIADVARFMGKLTSIIGPIVGMEGGIILYPQAKNVLEGKETNTTTYIAQ